MDDDIEVSEFHLGTETPMLSTYFHYDWRRKHSLSQKKKSYRGHFPEEWYSVGIRKELNKLIMCQIFVKHVVYVGAWDAKMNNILEGLSTRNEILKPHVYVL